MKHRSSQNGPGRVNASGAKSVDHAGVAWGALNILGWGVFGAYLLAEEVRLRASLQDREHLEERREA